MTNTQVQAFVSTPNSFQFIKNSHATSATHEVGIKAKELSLPTAPKELENILN